MSLQLAQVAGVVSWSNPEDSGIFKIYCPNMKKTFDATCSFFCPLREGDTINALCSVSSEGKLQVVKPPFVQLSLTKDTVVQCLMKVLKTGYQKTAKVYSKLTDKAGGEALVIPLLTELAQNWDQKADIDILYSLDGFEPEQTKKLLTWWHKHCNVRRLYLLGLTKTEINACRLKCEDIYKQCLQNPYVLPAVPLEKCEVILERTGNTVTEEQKVCGSILRIIWKNLHDGSHTGTPLKFLKRQFPEVEKHLPQLESEYGVKVAFSTVYLSFPWKVETFLAKFFSEKLKQDWVTPETPLDTPVKVKGKTRERLSSHFTRNTLSEEQKTAIQGILDHTLCLVTGGAGVGKTTVLDEVIRNLELRKTKYAVCSFTGKAVARLREVTKKRSPCTIHRLLANTRRTSLDFRSNQFEKDIPLRDYEHIIVDEASMVTSELFFDLVQAYPDVEKFTFVGDVNQLQPIGWGSLFKELLESGKVPTYRLTNNFRVLSKNENADGIISNTVRLVSGEVPFRFKEEHNFSILEGPEERVFDLVKDCLSRGVKVDDLVILTPFNKSLLSLNKTFQDIYCHGEGVTDSRGVTWKVGDRVMLTENDASIGVFNGETGFVKEVSDNAILVEFGSTGCHEFPLESTGEREEYEYATAATFLKQGKEIQEVKDGDEGELDNRSVKRLVHAYALTVDKSQGSEWENVIFFVPELAAHSFLHRNRVYTALTRAKKNVWVVVSDTDAFNDVAPGLPPFRCDNLSVRLC